MLSRLRREHLPTGSRVVVIDKLLVDDPSLGILPSDGQWSDPCSGSQSRSGASPPRWRFELVGSPRKVANRETGTSYARVYMLVRSPTACPTDADGEGSAPSGEGAGEAKEGTGAGGDEAARPSTASHGEHDVALVAAGDRRAPLLMLTLTTRAGTAAGNAGKGTEWRFVDWDDSRAV